MLISYDAVQNLAKEKGASPRKLFVAISQLARMENAESTVTAILDGDFSVTRRGAISLYDDSDPNRSEVDHLYQQAS